jgi:NADH dehydrogenase FAD-containing subunit
VMEQAQFQLESTLTAMGTVYSQIMILSARDVASGRAQRLQQDVKDQVQALQDVVTTMDEVYRAGDALGLDVSAPAQPAPATAPQARQKGTTGH